MAQDLAALAGMSDASVAKATGHSWADWCVLLDAEKAHTLTHKQIALLVHEKFNGGDWWSQMVTVGYERIRGLREKNEKTDGFAVSASKTFTAPLESVYSHFADAKRRKLLLGAVLALRTAQENKSIRLDGPNLDGTRVAIYFYGKPGGKTLVTVEHGRLKSAEEVAARKAFWLEAFAGLAAAIKP